MAGIEHSHGHLATHATADPAALFVLAAGLQYCGMMDAKPAHSALPRPIDRAEPRTALRWLLTWRRDVRRFETTPVDRDAVIALLHEAQLAPSVGNSQPWRFVLVDDPARRAAVRASFVAANAAAAAAQPDHRRQRYQALKLAGLDEAPVHLAVFSDHAAAAGHGLGRATMPQTLDYSVVCAIHTLWLLARAEGLGLGWISILDPATVTAALEVPQNWALIGYFCLGVPTAEHDVPELERSGWQPRLDPSLAIFNR